MTTNLLEIAEAVDILKEAATEAGAVALALQKNALSVDLKADESVVSNGDFASEKRALEVLRARCPRVPFVSEETPATGLPADHFIVLDPIDGTADYVNGGVHWGVLIAYVVAGRAVAGVIAQPELERVIWGGQGLGVHVSLKGEVSRVTPRDAEAPFNELILGTEIGPWIKQLPQGFIEGLIKDFRFIRCNGTAAAGIAEFVLGQTTGYIHTQGSKVWDLAVGAALARALGGGALDLEGREMRHASLDCHGILARSPDQARRILRHLGYRT